MRNKDVSTTSMNTVVTKHGARLRALPQYALEAVLDSRARVNKRVYNAGNPDLHPPLEIATRYPACEYDAA